MSVFRSAVAVHPNNGKMLSNIGSQLETDDDRTLSIEFFRHAIRVEPHFITAYSNLAQSHMHTKGRLERLRLHQEFKSRAGWIRHHTMPDTLGRDTSLRQSASLRSRLC